MKKLLLLTAILAIGATAFASGNGHGNGGGGGPLDLTTGGYTMRAENDYAELFGDVREDLGLHNGTTPYGITDYVNNSQPRVNLFREEGKGWTAEDTTKVHLKVIEKVSIKAANKMIKAIAVQDDVIALGNIMFQVTGAADTLVNFEFKGPLFKLEGHSSLAEIGGIEAKEQPGFADMGTEIKTRCEGYEKEFEIDLYFDLADVEPGQYNGKIVATAEYQ